MEAKAEDTIANQAVGEQAVQNELRPTDVDPHFVMDPQPMIEFSQPPRRPFHWTMGAVIVVVGLIIVLAVLTVLLLLLLPKSSSEDRGDNRWGG